MFEFNDWAYKGGADRIQRSLYVWKLLLIHHALYLVSMENKVTVRKKSKGKSAALTAFNVTYEDGTITSNRRVSNDLLDQSFGDSLEDLARTAIENQDNEIAQRSGQRRAKIKSIAQI